MDFFVEIRMKLFKIFLKIIFKSFFHHHFHCSFSNNLLSITVRYFISQIVNKIIMNRYRNIRVKLWKMKPLATDRHVMMWLCMFPADESTSKTKRMLYIAFTFIVTTISLYTLYSSVVFIINYLLIDFERCLYAVFQIAAEAAMLNLVFVALFNRYRIATIFIQLSEIYTASKDHQLD